MHLYTTQTGIEKVTDHGNAISPTSRHRLIRFRHVMVLAFVIVWHDEFSPFRNATGAMMCCQETFRRQENQQQRSLLPNHEVPVVLISYTVKLVEEFVPNTT